MAKIDDEIKTRFENNKQRFIVNLMYTSNCFQNFFIRALKPYGLSPQQLNVLRILRGAGQEMTINSIKDLMVDNSPNLARLADKLVAKELIERQRSASDRRVVYLTISKPGLSLLEKIDNDDVFSNMKYWDSITESEAEKFSALLDKIRD